jgi:hypothetical protein
MGERGGASEEHRAAKNKITAAWEFSYHEGKAMIKKTIETRHTHVLMQSWHHGRRPSLAYQPPSRPSSLPISLRWSWHIKVAVQLLRKNSADRRSAPGRPKQIGRDLCDSIMIRCHPLHRADTAHLC